jgi:hypothetical protein
MIDRTPGCSLCPSACATSSSRSHAPAWEGKPGPDHRFRDGKEEGSVCVKCWYYTNLLFRIERHWAPMLAATRDQHLTQTEPRRKPIGERPQLWRDRGPSRNSGDSIPNSWTWSVSAAHPIADPGRRSVRVRCWPASDRRLDARPKVSANGRSATRNGRWPCERERRQSNR